MDVARDRVFYFTFAVLGLTLSLGLDVLPGIVSFGTSELSPWLALPVIVTGVLMLTALLHLASKVARLHGMFAKNLLVST